MDDLFESLKAEPPINKYVATAPPSPPLPSIEAKKPDLIIDVDNIEVGAKSTRRESMPPPITTTVKRKSDKSRSLSPPKIALPSSSKSLRVLVERAKISTFATTHNAEKEEIITTVDEQQQKENYNQNAIFNKISSLEKEQEEAKSESLHIEVKSPVVLQSKSTPTKAQQKLFEPPLIERAEQLNNVQVKRCKVRVRRENLQKLQKQFKKIATKASASAKSQTANIGRKRQTPSPTKSPKLSPPKKVRIDDKESKRKSAGFFIKITPSRIESKLSPPKNKLNNSPPSKNRDVGKTTKLSPTKKIMLKSQNNKIAKPRFKTTSKFTRTQLMKIFGRRFFRSYVRIERCSHPLMLTFESNARALQSSTKAKKNRSKNLSVSFRDQVEIFGDSDSDDADISNGAVDDVASTSQAAMNKLVPASGCVPATPTRLRKIENGKVVDDIELDTTLFIGPVGLNASTPFATTGRKKRDKKSYSPLKGDGTPSPRKEQLKLANEKLPPSGLRRLGIDVDDDDDDDEDEYIVPTDIPSRRSSNASSTSQKDQRGNEGDVCLVQIHEANSNENAADVSVSNNFDSSSSFASAQDHPIGMVGEIERIPEDLENEVVGFGEQKETNASHNSPSFQTVAEEDASGEVTTVAHKNNHAGALLNEIDYTMAMNNDGHKKNGENDDDVVSDASSPTPSVNSLKEFNNAVKVDLGESVENSKKSDIIEEGQKRQRVEDAAADHIESADVCQLKATIHDEIGLQLYVDDDFNDIDVDSQSGRIVESIINETLNDVSKDIEMD